MLNILLFWGLSFESLFKILINAVTITGTRRVSLVIFKSIVAAGWTLFLSIYYFYICFDFNILFYTWNFLDYYVFRIFKYLLDVLCFYEFLFTILFSFSLGFFVRYYNLWFFLNRCLILTLSNIKIKLHAWYTPEL